MRIRDSEQRLGAPEFRGWVVSITEHSPRQKAIKLAIPAFLYWCFHANADIITGLYGAFTVLLAVQTSLHFIPRQPLRAAGMVAAALYRGRVGGKQSI